MAEDMFPMQARGLGVRFGAVEALAGVDLTLEARSRIVVLGDNGAGKSVLLRALHGLIAPTSGTLRWGAMSRRPAAQAMVFQRPVMLRRSALANVEYGLAVGGAAQSERRERARRSLDQVGLSHLALRQARVLSGGEQQRVAIARAWALEPRALFLDEPTSSLDPGAAGEVERIVGQIHSAGTAVVMTTHNLGLARRFGHEIVFLHQGRVTEQTPADSFFTSPRSAEAARFLEEELPWSTESRSS